MKYKAYESHLQAQGQRRRLCANYPRPNNLDEEKQTCAGMLPLELKSRCSSSDCISNFHQNLSTAFREMPAKVGRSVQESQNRALLRMHTKDLISRRRKQVKLLILTWLRDHLNVNVAVRKVMSSMPRILTT